MRSLVRGETPAEYFKELVEKALENQKFATSKLSSFYLVHLLETFVRRERACPEVSVGENPRLAELLCQALTATGIRQIALFKIAGDLSLFISGFFADSLSRTSVDTDYCASVGGYAYSRLSHSSVSPTAAEMFSELSQNFIRFVDVLAEVSEASSITDNRSLLRLYERWIRTGSRRSADLLRRAGLVLASGSSRIH